MRKNIGIVLAISALFGLAFGLYEFVLPYFLDEHHISYRAMGFIFSASAVAMFLVRIGAGAISDFTGRKVFYSLSLILCGLSTLLTPLFPLPWPQMLLKSVREAAVVTRESMHSLLLFDASERRFVEFYARTRGAEFFFQGGGAILAGLFMAWWGNARVLYASAVLLLFAFLLFMLGYHESFTQTPLSRERLKWVDLINFDMSRELKWLTAWSFVFTVGLATSHCFVMPLFFAKKFAAPSSTVGWIMAVHRASLGLPMFFIGDIVRTRLKATWIVFLVLEGLMIAASALLPGFWLATLLWLTHDFVGAAIWVPISNHYTQVLARENVRGRDATKSVAYSSLGWIIGPLLAGYLMSVLREPTASISAPFFLSGILMVVSAVFILPLPDIELERRA